MVQRCARTKSRAVAQLCAGTKSRDMGSRSFKVGIVGAGYVAAHHLRALRDLPFVERVGITDLDDARARQLAATFGVAGVYGSLSQMAEARPDVIHVLTPPASHRAIALEALSMGCHVLVEKPMAENAEECEEMIARARKPTGCSR